MCVSHCLPTAIPGDIYIYMYICICICIHIYKVFSLVYICHSILGTGNYFFISKSGMSFTMIVPLPSVPNMVMTFLTTVALVFDTAMCSPNLYWGQD